MINNMMGWSFKKKQPKPRMRSPRLVSSVNDDNNNLRAAFAQQANRLQQPKQNDKRMSLNHQPDTELKNKYSKLTRRLTLISLCILLVIVLIGLYVSSNAKVVIVQPNNYNYMPHTLGQYQEVADKALNSSIYNHFKITLSSNDIQQKIQQVFPEVNFVAVTVPFIGSKPTVYIQLTKPAIVFQSAGGSYILDYNGLVITNAASLNAKELATLPVVQEPITENIKDGDLLAIHSCDHAENGKIIVARMNNKLIIRRYFRHGDQVELKAENPDHSPIHLNAAMQPFTIEGVGVGVIRTHSV